KARYRSWRDAARGEPLTSRIGLFDGGMERVYAGSQKVLWRLRWSAVKEIAVWKDDLFGYDCICVGFRIAEEPNYFWVDEEMPGWQSLWEELAKQFGLD